MACWFACDRQVSFPETIAFSCPAEVKRTYWDWYMTLTYYIVLHSHLKQPNVGKIPYDYLSYSSGELDPRTDMIGSVWSFSLALPMTPSSNPCGFLSKLPCDTWFCRSFCCVPRGWIPRLMGNSSLRKSRINMSMSFNVLVFEHLYNNSSNNTNSSLAVGSDRFYLV